jgi:PKD repeat protein
MKSFPSESSFMRTRAHSRKKKKLTNNLTTLTLISLLLISLPITLFSTTVYADEPSIDEALDVLGFTNISLTSVETFPPGIYQATFLAEFGFFYDINSLSYYPVGTSDYQTLFSGPEGANADMGGYVVPPLSKMFTANSQFGLSMLAQYRYFTEVARNPDYPEQHARVYANLNSPNMYLICFEDTLRGYDRDYNDMIVSLVQIFPPEITSVSRYPETPTYDQSVKVVAQVTKGSAEIASVILSYQIGSGDWTNVPMSLDGSDYVANIPAQTSNTQVTYKVTATDTNGYSGISTLNSYTVLIIESSPIAIFVYSPDVTNTGEEINFDASSSYDPDGTIMSYSWDFGDGTTSSGATVSHSYEENGKYTVTLTVVDDDGLVGRQIATATVKNRAPVASFTVSATVINEKDTVSFDATESYDLDGTIVSYIWGFGDGEAATGIKTNHMFEYSGVYTVTLAVTDNDGAAVDVTHTVTVKSSAPNVPPVASFTQSAETVNVGETVSFDASASSDSDGTLVNYSWAFGDGISATGVTADHAYSVAGTYTVTLTVTDDDGSTDSTTTAVSITTPVVPNQSPVASFTESAQTVSSGENIHFDASKSSDSDGTIVSYSWTFGDEITATGVTADHVYSAEGTYTVTLTVTDDDGASSSVSAEMTVGPNTTSSVAVLAGIGIGIAALVAALLIGFFIRKKKKKKTGDN